MPVAELGRERVGLGVLRPPPAVPFGIVVGGALRYWIGGGGPGGGFHLALVGGLLTPGLVGEGGGRSTGGNRVEGGCSRSPPPWGRNKREGASVFCFDFRLFGVELRPYPEPSARKDRLSCSADASCRSCSVGTGRRSCCVDAGRRSCSVDAPGCFVASSLLQRGNPRWKRLS